MHGLAATAAAAAGVRGWEQQARSADGQRLQYTLPVIHYDDQPNQMYDISTVICPVKLERTTVDGLTVYVLSRECEQVRHAAVVSHAACKAGWRGREEGGGRRVRCLAP